MYLKLCSNKKSGKFLMSVGSFTPLGFFPDSFLFHKEISKKEYLCIMKQIFWNAENSNFKEVYHVERDHSKDMSIQTYKIYDVFSKLKL